MIKPLIRRYYIRCASLARHLYMRGNAGVGAFRKVYGGSKDNGCAPSHFHVANGNIIRKCLQSLEQVKMVKKSDFRGRVITPTGRRDMVSFNLILPENALNRHVAFSLNKETHRIEWL